ARSRDAGAGGTRGSGAAADPGAAGGPRPPRHRAAVAVSKARLLPEIPRRLQLRGDREAHRLLGQAGQVVPPECPAEFRAVVARGRGTGRMNDELTPAARSALDALRAQRGPCPGGEALVAYEAL